MATPSKAAPKKAAAKSAAPKVSAKSAAPKKAAPKKAASAGKPAAAPSPNAQTEQAHQKDIERQVAKAEHAHQDPRGPAHQPNPAAQAHGMDPRKDQGAIKNRGVPRMNKIVNWFRRGKGR